MKRKLQPPTSLSSIQTADPLKRLIELSFELGFNYVSNSFGDKGDGLVNYTTLMTPDSDLFNHEIFLDNSNNTLELFGKTYEIKDDKTKSSIGNAFEERKSNRQSCRNIVVIGAGASFDSYGCIPMGNAMKNALKNRFIKPIKDNTFLTQKFHKEFNEIKKLTNRDDLDFENFLSLLLKIFVEEETLRETIKSYIGFKHAPSLFYEIIAHMLKHSLVDVVINFNFDEMLDQAIYEELGKDNFHYVLSDGHSVSIEDILVDGRIKIPVYIKPHGTFSHKSSLRFTKQHYLDSPGDIKEMIAKLVSGYRGKNGGKEIQRINLICIGFNLASIEFNEILDLNLPPHSKIYHFNVTDKTYEMQNKFETGEFLPNFYIKAKRAGKKFNDIYNSILLDSNCSDEQFNSLLGSAFSSLWRIIDAQFNRFYSPRSISRHEITNYFFYNRIGYSSTIKKSNGKQREEIKKAFENSPKYFRDKVLVEIAIQLLRHKGLLDIVNLLEGRAGLYFKTYQEFCKKNPSSIREIHSIYDLLSEFSIENADTSTSDSFFNKRNYKYSKNIFSLTLISDSKAKSDFVDEFIKKIQDNFRLANSSLMSENKSDNSTDKLNNLVEALRILSKHETYLENFISIQILLFLLSSQKLSESFKLNFLSNCDKTANNGLDIVNRYQKTNVPIIEELFRLFSKGKDSNYFHIGNRINGLKQMLWESIKPKDYINTNLALIYEFQNTFLYTNWDCLLAVLEKGEMLRNIYSNLISNFDNSKLEKLSERRIILLLSYENTLRLHEPEGLNLELVKFYRDSWDAKGKLLPKPEEENRPYLIEALKNVHLNYLVPLVDETNENGKKINEILHRIRKNIDIVFLPTIEHNNHTSIFLKTIDKSNDVYANLSNKLLTFEIDAKTIEKYPVVKKYKKRIQDGSIFIIVGGIHMYQKGFSKSVNPIKLDLSGENNKTYLKRDFDKMLLLFFKNLCRGITFQVSNAGELKYGTELVIDNLHLWKTWSSEEFYHRAHVFITNIYYNIKTKTDREAEYLGIDFEIDED